MKIVAPISASDMESAERWADAIIHYGNLANHSIAILPTLEAIPTAEEILQRFIDAGINAEILNMELIPAGGWPKAPNTHFFEAARLMSRQMEPWFWMEMDCLPVRQNWADMLAAAYTSCNARFMGWVGPTPWRDDTTGRRVPSPFGEGDIMLTGCSIYPANMFALPEIAPLLYDLVKGEASPDTGFDIHLRFAINNTGMSHSILFADKWNTINFRIEDGKLTCDSKPDHVGVNPNFDQLRKGGDVSPSSAVVHGCKDSSLHALIMAGLDMATLAVKHLSKPQSTEAQATQTTGSGIAQQSPVRDDEIESLKGELSELKAMLKAALTQTTDIRTETTAAASEPTTPTSDEDRLVGLLSEAAAKGKSIRIDMAAEKLGIKKDRLTKVVDSSSRITKKAMGWLALSR